jgi:hypothetical protein
MFRVTRVIMNKIKQPQPQPQPLQCSLTGIPIIQIKESMIGIQNLKVSPEVLKNIKEKDLVNVNVNDNNIFEDKYNRYYY